MADRSRHVLSFGPNELSIGNRLVINGTKVVPLGARIDGLGETAKLVVDLRAATSLAIVEKSEARRQQARSMLRSTHAKFRNGSDTFDLRLAARVRDGSYWCDGATGTLR